jgi:hypothetical protein
MTSKTILLCGAIFFIITFLTAGCHKNTSNSSQGLLTGTWISSTEHLVVRVNNAITKDTITQRTGLDTLTFTASGQFITNLYGASGTYSIIGDSLTIFNTLSSAGIVSKVTTLTASSLSITKTDTSNHNPVTTETYTDNYTH